MFTICYRHRPSRRCPGRRSDGPGQGPVKPESAGFGPIPGKTRGFLADTSSEKISHYYLCIGGRQAQALNSNSYISCLPIALKRFHPNRLNCDLQTKCADSAFA